MARPRALDIGFRKSVGGEGGNLDRKLTIGDPSYMVLGERG